MVYFPAFARETGEYADCLVKRAGHKLLPVRSKVDAQHCIHMVLVDEFGFIHFPHIEGIAVSVLVANHKVDGLVGVPADAGRLVLEEEFLERGVPIDVVEDDGSVHAGRGNEVSLGRVELAAGYLVDSPVKDLSRVGPFVVPNLDNLA